MVDLNNELEELEKKRESARLRMFFMMIETAFIFAIPAVLALILGRKLDAVYNTDKTILFSLLILSFIFSWIIVIFRYRRALQSLTQLSKTISDKKQKIHS